MILSKDLLTEGLCDKFCTYSYDHLLNKYLYFKQINALCNNPPPLFCCPRVLYTYGNTCFSCMNAEI